MTMKKLHFATQARAPATYENAKACKKMKIDTAAMAGLNSARFAHELK